MALIVSTLNFVDSWLFAMYLMINKEWEGRCWSPGRLPSAVILYLSVNHYILKLMPLKVVFDIEIYACNLVHSTQIIMKFNRNNKTFQNNFFLSKSGFRWNFKISWELYDYDPSLSAAKERKRHWQINYIKHKLSSNKKL